MKTLITFLAFILPVLVIAQDVNVSPVILKTLDEKNVKSSDILHDGQRTLVFFFNDRSSGVIENLEYLEALKDDSQFDQGVQIIAIYNASNGSYGNIRAFLEGNCIDINTYIDINGEFQRSLGLADNSTILLSGFNVQPSERYAGSITCSEELISLVSKMDSNPDNNDKAESRTITRNSFSNK